MERVGIYFKVRPGETEHYKEVHRNVGQELLGVLTKAGIRNYSIWSLEEKLFAYYEVDDAQKMKEVLEGSEVYRRWRKRMEEIVYIDPQNGQKEWAMEEVFYKK